MMEKESEEYMKIVGGVRLRKVKNLPLQNPLPTKIQDGDKVLV